MCFHTGHLTHRADMLLQFQLRTKTRDDCETHPGRFWRTRWSCRSTARWASDPSGSYWWRRRLTPQSYRWRSGCLDLQKQKHWVRSESNDKLTCTEETVPIEAVHTVVVNMSLGCEATSDLCCRRWWEPGCRSAPRSPACCWSVRSPPGETLRPAPGCSRPRPPCWSSWSCNNQTDRRQDDETLSGSIKRINFFNYFDRKLWIGCRVFTSWEIFSIWE